MNRSSMDGPSSGRSILPWLWILEYLTSYPQVVPTSILYGLIKEAPPLPDDLKGKVDELVALTCLEELCGVGYEPSVTTVAMSEIDLSKTCQDVLKCILQEASVSDIMTRTKPLRWHIKPFILHKRAAMPKTSLQKLKDAILDGSCRIESSLKKMSGVQSAVDFQGVPAAAGESEFLHPNAKKRKMTRNPVSENLADNLHEGQQTCDDFDHLTDSQLKQFMHDALAPEEPATVNESGKPENVKKVGFSVEDDDTHMSRDQMGTPTGESADPRKNSENGSDHRNPVLKNAVNGHLSAEPPEDNLDTGILEEKEQSSSRDVNQHEETDITMKKNDFVRSQDTGILEEKEPSSGRDVNQDNETDITMKKSDFLRSQYTHMGDSLDDWTARYVCVKCSKDDDQLLVCRTESCPLAVHEKCLGFSVTFDETGNFCCPFCLYSAAVKDYRESKKNASLLRKDMAAFML